MSPAAPKPPDVSIDEALRLFLALSYPDGPPEGVDAEQLLEAMRQKVAADRPEWAAASAARKAPPLTDGEASAAEPGYSRVKAEIAERARREEVPDDPEERYFHDRAKEARENRERRRAEEREDRVREELRQRFVAEKKGADEASLGRVLRIRQVLEERVRRVLETKAKEAPVQEKLKTGGPTRLALGRPMPEAAGPLVFSGAEPSATQRGLSMPDEGRELVEHLRNLEPSEQIESLRQFNRARREQLRSRSDVLGSRRPRRPFRRYESLEVEGGETADPIGLELEDSSSARDFELSMSSRRRKRGLSLA